MLKLRNTAGVIEVVFQDQVVLRHSEKDPLLSLGVGKGSYTMRHGSFKIKDALQERQTPLKCQGREEAGDVLLDFGPVTLRLSPTQGWLVVTFTASKDYNRLWLNLPAANHEAVFGCGEQYSVMNLRGRRVPIWCQEQGIGRGRDLITFLAELTHGAGGAWHTTYFPQPTFVTTTNRFCHVVGSAYMEFDFRSPEKHQLHCWELPQAIYLGLAQSPVNLMKELTSLLGRQPALPQWVNDGVWLGIQGGRAVADKKLAAFKEAGGQAGALWCQDWEGIRYTSFGKQLMWDWRRDEELYPHLLQWSQELQEQGVRFLGYINPFLALEGQLYQEASQRGFLVGHPQGGEYHVKITDFPAAMLDLTNPETCTWIKGVIRDNLLGAGLSGWMADFGEYLPVDAVLHSGESAETYHNKYPVVWARLNREAIQEARREDVTFFSRAGYSGTSREAPIIWAGDQLVNWSLDDGLASVIPAGLSLGLSGIGHFHSDIGGYTTVGWIKRSKELFMRWAEQAAFSPLMRTHEGNRPTVNHQFDSDAETLAHFARMSRVHVRLKPYLAQARLEYQEQGLPLMRHLWLHYPQERMTYDLKYQYLLGRDLLVAPVLKKGATSVRVYLPGDQWIHLWTGKEHSPGWQRVEAPIGYPPVFCRGGGSIQAQGWDEI
jgi:alpha-glucosidase